MLRFLATALACAFASAVPYLPNESSESSGPVIAAAADDAELTDLRLPPQAASPASTDTPEGFPREVRIARKSVASKVLPAFAAAQIGAESDAKIDLDAKQDEPSELTRDTICQVLREVAAENGLPEPLFMRLIWQESRFRARAVSPAGAQGIAQFMPATAAERGLGDPFDPIQALPASAEFLRQLTRRFGNFGLAAAAYNGGPRRVQEWLDGRGGLPKETRHYVIHITGRTAEHWAEAADKAEPHPEAYEAEDCRVRPLQAALAEIREQERKAAAREAAERAKATWVALLTGEWTQSKARTVVAKLQKKYPKVLGRHEPVVRVAKASGKRPPKAHVRIVADTRAEAQALCKRLKEAGGSCVVEKSS